jgi:hypothetical protein
VRRATLIGAGVMLLVGVGLFVADSLIPRPSPPVQVPATVPSPPEEPIPVLPPVEPDPNFPYTPNEQAIRRYLTRGRTESDPKSRACQARDERAFFEAGGHTPAALPFYLRLLTTDSGFVWAMEVGILHEVSGITADRSAFRRPAAERLKHSKGSTVESAVRLLKEIGTPAEAAEVARLIENFEFDRPGQVLRDGLAYAILDTLAATGSEAEIKALEQAKARNFLWDNDKFWAKAEECKVAIRERVAKEKEKADKK